MDSYNISASLLNLPLALQNDILGSWLINTDICKLDTAFCSKEMRPLFLNLLASGINLYHTPELTELEHICSWMAWVVQRKVCIDDCLLSSDVPPALYMPFFINVCKTLTSITIFASRKVHAMSEFASMIATIAYSCRNLSQIQLQNCRSLNSLENLLHACKDSLKVIHLLCCDLSELKLRNIHLPSLKRLIEENCTGISESVASAFLEGSPNLEILNCRRLFISYPVFRKPTKLRVVILFDSSQLTDAMFCTIIHNCPLLEVIKLMNCSQLTDLSLVELAHHGTHLSTLYLNQNANFSDIALEAIALHFGERLKHFNLCTCTAITDTGLSYISKKCHQLEGLHVSSMQHISTAAMASVLRMNPLLREVTLGSYSDLVDGRGDMLLTVVATCCPFLEDLQFYNLKGYTETGVFAVIESCPALQSLIVNPNCTVINPFSRMLLEKRNPKLVIEGTDLCYILSMEYYLDAVDGTEMLED